MLLVVVVVVVVLQLQLLPLLRSVAAARTRVRAPAAFSTRVLLGGADTRGTLYAAARGLRRRKHLHIHIHVAPATARPFLRCHHHLPLLLLLLLWRRWRRRLSLVVHGAHGGFGQQVLIQLGRRDDGPPRGQPLVGDDW